MRRPWHCLFPLPGCSSLRSPGPSLPASQALLTGRSLPSKPILWLWDAALLLSKRPALPSPPSPPLTLPCGGTRFGRRSGVGVTPW